MAEPKHFENENPNRCKWPDEKNQPIKTLSMVKGIILRTRHNNNKLVKLCQTSLLRCHRLCATLSRKAHKFNPQATASITGVDFMLNQNKSIACRELIRAC